MVNIFRFELARNLSLALFLLALAVPARAALVFSDSFDLDEPPGTSILNYTGFANWDITAGAIDLIGHGGFGIACQSIACVDMDGTSGAAGTLATKATFGAGSYTIRFDISGNQRNGNGGTDSLTVTFGDLTESFELAFDDPYTTIVRSATVGVGGSKIVFDHAGSDGSGNDQLGIILDNVSLDDSVAIVAPGSALMFAMALVGVCLRRRRR